MDAIVLKDKPTDEKCNDCSLTYIKDGIIINGIIHELFDHTIDENGCTRCSLSFQCPNKGMGVGICDSIFVTGMCHFEIK